MNSDIRLSVGFWRQPKVYRLERALGLKGVRSLQILWCWCAQNRPDGNLADLDASEIEFVADWRGKKGSFVEACVGCKWLDETDDGFMLHEWADYNPYQAKAGAARKPGRKRRGTRQMRAGERIASLMPVHAQTMLKHMLKMRQAYAQTMLKHILKMPRQCYKQCSKNAFPYLYPYQEY